MSWRTTSCLAVVAAAFVPGGCGRAGSAALTSTATRAPLRATLPAFAAVAFPGREDGWVVGTRTPDGGGAEAEVWHTTNGGASWSVQWQGPGDGISISALDSRRAWVLIGCSVLPDEPGCGRAELIATADAGETWRVVSRLPATANDVQFATPRLGVLTADKVCLSVSPQSRCPGQVLITRDGGADWTVVLSAKDPVFATMNSHARLWAAEVIPGPGGKFAPAAPSVRFLTSGDAGARWSAIGELVGLGLSGRTEVQLAAGAGGIRWASVFDQESCAMHGCASALLYGSDDGGHSWRLEDLGRQLAGQCGPDGITFSAAQDGTVWAATGQNGGACSPPFGILYRRTGSGWRQLTPWQLDGVRALSAVDGDVAYAISGENAVVRSDDGGRSWRQLLPSPVPRGALVALDARTALGTQSSVDAGAIMRTSDGGASWRQIASLPGVVTQLQLVTARRGIAVTFETGSRGESVWKLWQTVDGGGRWRLQARLLRSDRDGNAGIYGPWMNAAGHGVLLTVADTIPWEESSSGGGPPARVWTTGDWGAHWHAGRLLPLGRGLDSLLGAVSIVVTRSDRWSGWAIRPTGRGYGIAAIAGGGQTLTPLAASPPISGMQLVADGVGYAWGLRASTNAFVLYGTRDAGRTWRAIRLPGLRRVEEAPAGPFVDFTDPNDGWLLFGQTSWHTADGGRSWRPEFPAGHR